VFRSFYAAREQSFPNEFALEPEHILTLREPERTTKLDSLNHRIPANLTKFFSHAKFGKINLATVRRGLKQSLGRRGLTRWFWAF
jgi:hypothetical protein